MSRPKNLDPARAFRAARVLRRYVAIHAPHAAKPMQRVVDALASCAVVQLRAVPSLAAGTVALAILIENPGLSDAEIARRAGCNVKTLQRDTRYQRSRDLMSRGRADMPSSD